jgi:hypothetical protein
MWATMMAEKIWPLAVRDDHKYTWVVMKSTAVLRTSFRTDPSKNREIDNRQSASGYLAISLILSYTAPFKIHARWRYRCSVVGMTKQLDLFLRSRALPPANTSSVVTGNLNQHRDSPAPTVTVAAGRKIHVKRQGRLFRRESGDSLV